MKKRVLKGFGLLVLGFCSCSDFGNDVKLIATVRIDFCPGIIIEFTGDVIEFTNNTPLTVYYDSYPADCDGCIHTSVCLNPGTCRHIGPNGIAILEYEESGVIIRWWHLIPNEQGDGYQPDEVMYVQVP